MACSRRCLLAAGCVYPAVALAVPAESEAQSASTPTRGVTEVDLSSVAQGELAIVQWRGRPVWVLHRSPEMIERLMSPDLPAQLADPDSELTNPGHTPGYARNALRSIRREYFLGIAACPHAGCQPVARLKAGPHPERADNWPGGFACQCHFATFDLAGRVFRGKPTSENIQVPRHMYLSDSSIAIGRDKDGDA
ncbi:MAG TPA: ubiquinol-cytochrome c reductase iron-sulfur subunit [Burkholderiaceae bacterium]|nr:ubiquinol-cytochrome c reductase iron-sulfur subunit [Burkholderiaceae bacterium]